MVYTSGQKFYRCGGGERGGDAAGCGHRRRNAVQGRNGGQSVQSVKLPEGYPRFSLTGTTSARIAPGDWPAPEATITGRPC